MTSWERFIGAFNRLALILVAFAILFVAASLLADPQSVIAVLAAFTTGLGALPSAALRFDAVLAAAVALLVIVAESFRARNRGFFEARVEGGIVGYTSDAVAHALAAELSAREDIAEPRIEVTGTSGRAGVRVILLDSWGSDTPAIAGRVAARVRERAKAMGLGLGDVRVDIESVPADTTAQAPRVTVA